MKQIEITISDLNITNYECTNGKKKNDEQQNLGFFKWTFRPRDALTVIRIQNYVI